jgi:hypothetical protein
LFFLQKRTYPSEIFIDKNICCKKISCIIRLAFLFFLIKKETKKSRTKDVHPLRPAAMTDIGATVHQHL